MRHWDSSNETLLDVNEKLEWISFVFDAIEISFAPKNKTPLSSDPTESSKQIFDDFFSLFN